jgi:hypothetical protein
VWLGVLSQRKVISLTPCFERYVFTLVSIWGIANSYKYLVLTRRFHRTISTRTGPFTTHMTKTKILRCWLRPLVSSLRCIGWEIIYLCNHMRNRTRTHPELILKKEHEQLMVRECSALRLPFQPWQRFDCRWECAEPNVMSIFFSLRTFLRTSNT